MITLRTTAPLTHAQMNANFTEVDNNTSAIATLDNSVSSVTADLGALDVRVTSTENDISFSELTVASLSTDVAGLRDDVAAVEIAAQAIVAGDLTLYTTLDAHNTQVTATTAEITTAVAIESALREVDVMAETTRATTAESTNADAIVTLTNQISEVKTELNANQSAADAILTGTVARLNVTKTQIASSIVTYQALPPFNTGSSDFDTLLTTTVNELITELNNASTDIDAQIALLSATFSI